MKTKGVRKAPSKFGLFSKITIAIIFVIATVLGISTGISIERFSEQLLGKDRLLVKEATGKLEEYTHSKYNNLYNQMILMGSTNHITTIFSDCVSDPELIYDYSNVKFISDYLNALCNSDQDILDVILVLKDRPVAYSKSNGSNRSVLLSYDFSDLPCIQRLSSLDRNIIAEYDPDTPYIPKSTEPVVSFVGKLYNPKTSTKHPVLGYIIINYSPEGFDKVYSEINDKTKCDFFVLNDAFTIIYSNRSGYLGQNFRELTFAENDEVQSQIVGISGLQVGNVITDQSIRADSNQLVIQMIIIFAITILIICCIVMGFYKYYHRKISLLADTMYSLGDDNLDRRLPVTSADELGKLAEAFNQMCEKLDSYIKRNYKAEMARRTAELNALQSQINPHFLFNTIECIRMVARNDGNENVSIMLSKLGNMFRWMMQFDSRIVYLEDELEYITSYLYLQRLRFSTDINIDICVPDTLLYLGIPRFTLQPIVENAILHGFEDHTSQKEISLDAKEEDGMLQITIADNGKGITPGKFSALQQYLINGENKCGFGIGIKNVYDRLHLMFSDHCSFSIRSEEGHGTTVVLSIPALSKEGMEQYVSIDHR